MRMDHTEVFLVTGDSEYGCFFSFHPDPNCWSKQCSFCWNGLCI